MLDYQFLGMVAVVVAILTRGSLLPVAVVTAFVAVVLVVWDAGGRWFRARRSRPAPGEGEAEPEPESEPEPVGPAADLGQWMAAVERVLASKD